MSTRFGMADGRLTNNVSSRIYFDSISNGDTGDFKVKAFNNGTQILGNPFKAFDEAPQPWTVSNYDIAPFKGNKPL